MNFFSRPANSSAPLALGLFVTLVGTPAAASFFSCPQADCAPEAVVVVPVAAVVLNGTLIDGLGPDGPIEPPPEGWSAAQADIIDKSFEEATEILAPPCICLLLTHIFHEPVHVEFPTGGVNPDGTLETVEYDIDFNLGDAKNYGTHNIIDNDIEFKQHEPQASDLADNPPPEPLTTNFWSGKGKGYIVVFVNVLGGSSNVLGQTADDLVLPLNMVAFPDYLPSGREYAVATIGLAIAHEFAHLLGHLDHSPDVNNILYETGGTQFTQAQIDAIREGAQSRSLSSEHDSWQDDVGDASQPYIDLRRGHLYVADPPSDLDITFSLEGQFPDRPVRASLEAFFDVDNDPGTGEAFASFTGIDKILRISIMGSFPFEAGLLAEILDVSSGHATPLEAPAIRRTRLWRDYRPGTGVGEPKFTLDHDLIRQLIPLAALAPLSTSVPVGLRSTDLDSGESDYASFTLNMSEPFTPPVARCRDVTVEAGGDCTAAAGIDNESFDPDGDPISLAQNPPGPYGLGETLVELTVTDDVGITDTCEAVVTIVDVTPPQIQCNAPLSMTPSEAPSSYTASAIDNCDDTIVPEIVSYDCFTFTKKGRRVDKTESCIVQSDADTLTVVDSGGIGTHIVWEVRAVDASSNPQREDCGLSVELGGR